MVHKKVLSRLRAQEIADKHARSVAEVVVRKCGFGVRLSTAIVVAREAILEILEEDFRIVPDKKAGRR